MKKLFLLASLLLVCNFVSAQNYQNINHRIDSLIKIRLPKSALAEANSLYQLAIKNNNAQQQIRAVIYRMQLQPAVNGGGFVSVIDSLKHNIAQSGYPVKPILESLLAEVYSRYYTQYRWQFAQRTQLEKPDPDFTKWDLKTINNEIERLYKLSLIEYKREQATPIGDYDSDLNGDISTRYLRPTLYDLLVQRALTYFLSEEPALTRPQMPFTLNDARLFGSSQAFANLLIKTTDTASTFYNGIKFLQQVTLFHLQKPNEEALVDIDLQRLEFLNRQANLINKDELYVSAVRKIATDFASKPISADAQVLLGKYYQGADSLKLAVEYFEKAISTYPQSFGAKNAAGYLKGIRKKEISANIEDLNIPGKPLLGLLHYHNLSIARLIIYKVPSARFNELASANPIVYRSNGTGLRSSIIHPFDSVFRYLRKLTPVQDEPLQLPGTDDYKNHSAEFKVNPLGPGHYVLVVKDNQSNDSTLMAMTTFKVSHLSYVARYIGNQEQVRVMDRETGEPLPGVKLTDEESDHFTDANGSTTFGINTASTANSFKLTTKTDTLIVTKFNYYQPTDYNNTIIDRTILFTDRLLYRPGQTVYYKGIQLRTTGYASAIMPGVGLQVDVKDNNRKSFASTSVKTNEFGTFSGSFTIPQNILNGYITISTPNGNKMVRVEEYKRPSFEAEFLPVEQSYRPGDSVTLKGRVTAYSGYGLSNARVVYHISSSMYGTGRRNNSVYNISHQQTVVVADTIKTDSKGDFKIKFKILPIEDENSVIKNYNYLINVDVTDGSGETRSINKYVNINKNNIHITAPYPEKLYPRDSIPMAIKNLDNVAQSGTLQISVYALNNPAILLKKRFWNKPDQFLLNPTEFKNDFPDYPYRNEDDQTTWAVKAQVAGATLNTDGKFVVFKLASLSNAPTGIYKVVINAKNTQGDTVSETRYVHLISEPGMPPTINDWVTPLVTSVGNDTTATFLVGIGKPIKVLVEKRNTSQILSSKMITITGNQQQLVKVPVSANEQDVSISFLMVYQNRLYTNIQDIENKASNNLNIKFLTFRNKLQPGEKEEWKLQVSGKNDERQAAEMVANLYDASLDAIGGRDNWNTQLNYRSRDYRFQNFNWNNQFVSTSMTKQVKPGGYYFFNGLTRNYEKLGIRIVSESGKKNIQENSDILIDEPVGNTAYGVRYMADTVSYKVDSYAVGAPMLHEVTVARLNGRDYAGGNMAAAIQNLPAEVVAKIQVVNDYGDQAPRTLTPPIIPRTNFNETAFFYPQLHTDSTGQILIDFTIPESLTKWRFRAFAHTKDLKTGYIEREIVTQKQLSISANMPRFLREGDTLVVSARLANLTASALKGKVNLQLFNAVTMQPVSLLLNAAEARQDFNLAAATNQAVSFKLVIPVGLDALTYRLTATAVNYSDGEENTLPVLPNRMLVTETMPMMVRAGQTKSFTFNKLVNNQSNTLINKTLTLEYTQNPAWYALQALPYMMEFPYECSEQVFDRYYANSLATNLVNKMPVIKRVFDQWKLTNSKELLSNLEKNQELKSTLIEETPWLRDGADETEQKKNIALLFDLNKMSYEMQTNLDKLKGRQLPDGGFPWFGGDRSDAYITRYILAGIGQLYHSGAAESKNGTLKTITDKALGYLDNELITTANNVKKQNAYNDRKLGSTEIHEWYTESYFTTRSRSAEIKALLANYLQLAATQWTNKSEYEEGMIALTMLRNKKPEVAQMIIKSLMETASQSDEMGMYWQKNLAGYFWYEAPIETQSLMIELFTEVGNQPKAIEEMKIWLMRNKQTNNWKTTKATAQACYALLMKGDSLLNGSGTSIIKLDGQPLTQLKPEIKGDDGTGYFKTSWVDAQVKPELGKVEIANNGKSISWGALYWQYVEKLDKITASNTDINLERKYFIEKQTDNGPMLTAVDAKHIPKTGDVLKVVVYLKANRNFEYVQLKDMRPAGTEPTDVLSTYKYQDGLYYYQVTKDVATNFFISQLSKGNYVFEYRLRVVQPGNYSTGITSVQSMYAPEFSAHSEGIRMVIGK